MSNINKICKIDFKHSKELTSRHYNDFGPGWVNDMWLMNGKYFTINNENKTCYYIDGFWFNKEDVLLKPIIKNLGTRRKK